MIQTTAAPCPTNQTLDPSAREEHHDQPRQTPRKGQAGPQHTLPPGPRTPKHQTSPSTVLSPHRGTPRTPTGKPHPSRPCSDAQEAAPEPILPKFLTRILDPRWAQSPLGRPHQAPASPAQVPQWHAYSNPARRQRQVIGQPHLRQMGPKSPGTETQEMRESDPERMPQWTNLSTTPKFHPRTPNQTCQNPFQQIHHMTAWTQAGHQAQVEHQPPCH
ncbi:hypothetical protein ElyMa_005603000 [Elysia marginata]|uniref:Uncharacterized protein n=1 Tax=Elysia marginata TaxID=1093978 RepID=A0AAV4F4F1_9GAST|nr:hypothetical protein ElyMa_005603000 [Elysia marginata]